MASNENENDAAQVYLLGKTYLANNQGQFYIRNDPIIQMAAGDRHTIIITESGRAFAFGDNSSGQLGLGHTNNVEKVSCIKSLKFTDTGERVILAACGRDSSLVATNHGALYAFGSNSRHQLGIESTDPTLNQSQPVKIENFKSKMIWKQISMGAEHACALNEDGQAYVWGANDEGQCAQLAKYDVVKVPRELRVEQPVIAISCGYYHTAVITEDGQLFVCGNNEDRQLGRSISEKESGLVKVSLPNKALAVACGHQHTIVLTDKGEVYACGRGDRGQLGLGSRVVSSESFEHIPGLPKNVTAIAAGEGHTAVLGNRHDMYVFGDGKHGKLGSTTHTQSNEFEACAVDKFKSYNVLKVVCGGLQTIVLAQKKTSELKKSSGSDEDIGNATLSITQRPKSHARNIRNKALTDRSTTVTDSMDTTLQHVRPLGKANNLRVESDDDKSDKELSESLKSATFNQTHTIANGKFRPTQSPTLNRTSFRSTNDDIKPLRTGALDRTVRLNTDTDELTKTTNNRFPSIDKSPIRNTRFDRSSPPSPRKKRDSDEEKTPIRNTRFDRSSPPSPRKKRDSDEEKTPVRNTRFDRSSPRKQKDSDDDKSSSEEQARTFKKKSEPPPPIRNERKTSPLSRRKDDSESEENKLKRSYPTKTPVSETLNRKTRQQKRSEDEEEDDDEDDDESSRFSSRQNKQQPPPTAARRSSLPQQTRAGASVSSSRDGNQTIGSKPTDGVRGSFRSQATKTLAKPSPSTQNTDSPKKENTPAQQPGFFGRLFGSKSTPPPPPPPPTTTTTPAAAANSKTCSIM